VSSPIISRGELLRSIREQRAELEEQAAAFPEDLREREGSAGWSLKDHLAHVAAWEKSLLALLEGGDRGAAVGITREQHETLDTDAINSHIFDQHHGRPFEDVRADFDATHRRVLARLEGLTDEDFAKPYSHYQPGEPPYNERPVVLWVIGNTTDHYDEHITWLSRLRDELRG
jgi:hypothetical protein